MMCFLSGCLGGYSPQNRFYNLQPVDKANAKVIKVKNFSLGVGSVELPDYLDKPQIITMEDNSPEIKQAEHDRWGDNLSSMIQRILADDLSTYLPNAMVKSKIELTENFDYLLNVEIVKMDFVWNKKAVLEAWWYISDASGKNIKRQKFYAQEPINTSFAEFVEAESKMLGQMSYDIATEIANKKR